MLYKGTWPESSSAIGRAKKISHTVEGTFEGRKLVMRSVLDRIDWFLLPTDGMAEEAIMNSDSPSVGSPNETFELFSKVVEKWFSCEDLPMINRIAFGATLSRPIGDRRSAYIELRDYIPVDINPESTDILYQINLPTQSATVAGLSLNRLSKWLVAQHTILTFPLGAGGSPIPPALSPAAIRLELDINTVSPLRRRFRKKAWLDDIMNCSTPAEASRQTEYLGNETKRRFDRSSSKLTQRGSTY
jgi:hypothetical protein